MIGAGTRALVFAAAGAVAAAVTAPAGAEIKVEVRPDGTRVMVNTGPAPSRARSGDRAPSPSEAAARRAAANRRLEALIEEYSQRHGLDPRLVLAVIEVESAYRPAARSRKGAMGLMQLMPGTAAQLAVDDPYDPEQNVRGGTAYLARMLDRFGSLELALAAYNAGPEAVDRHGGVPPYRETRDYVERVLRLYDGRAASLPATPAPRGRKPYIVRGSDGKIVLTTDP